MNNSSKLAVSNKAKFSRAEQLTRSALSSSNRGWRVFRLQPLSKTHTIKGWRKTATTSRDTIESWWGEPWNEQENIFCNIGIKTGKDSNLLVIDLNVDSPDHPGAQGKESWQALLDEYTGGVELETYTVQTPSGGLNLYFQYPQYLEIDLTTRSKFRPGLIFYGEGSYAVGTGSLVRMDGKIKAYSVIKNLPLAPCPNWLIDVLTEPQANLEQVPQCVSTGEDNLQGEGQSFDEADQEEQLYVYAISLFRRGLTEEEVSILVLRKVEIFVPPLPINEALVKVKSAFKSFQDCQRPLTKEEAVQLINQNHALISKPPVIISEFRDKLGYLELEYISRADLNLLYLDKKVLLSPSGKETTPDKVWLHSPERRRYKSIVFDPAKNSKGCYNLFTGFPIKPVEGNCDLFLSHIENIVCEGNSIFSNYVLNWMAHLFQKPAELPGVTLILKGRQGTGKGLVANTLIKLVGPHAIHLTKMEQLTGRFGSHLADKLFVFADEALWGGNKQDNGQLKAMITEDNFAVEPKGKECYPVQNYKRLIIASNEDWPVPLDLDDRRFTTLELRDSKVGDHAYFKALHQQLDSGGREALMDYFLKRDISNFEPYSDKPFSRHDTELKIRSMNPIQKWWLSRLTDFDSHNWPKMEDCKTLHEAYLDWCKQNRYRHTLDQGSFGKELVKLVDIDISRPSKRYTGISSSSSGRHRIYTFPDYETCKEKFKEVAHCRDEVFGDKFLETEA